MKYRKPRKVRHFHQPRIEIIAEAIADNNDIGGRVPVGNAEPEGNIRRTIGVSVEAGLIIRIGPGNSRVEIDQVSDHGFAYRLKAGVFRDRQAAEQHDSHGGGQSERRVPPARLEAYRYFHEPVGRPCKRYASGDSCDANVKRRFRLKDDRRKRQERPMPEVEGVADHADRYECPR